MFRSLIGFVVMCVLFCGLVVFRGELVGLAVRSGCSLCVSALASIHADIAREDFLLHAIQHDHHAITRVLLGAGVTVSHKLGASLKGNLDPFLSDAVVMDRADVVLTLLNNQQVVMSNHVNLIAGVDMNSLMAALLHTSLIDEFVRMPWIFTYAFNVALFGGAADELYIVLNAGSIANGVPLTKRTFSYDPVNLAVIRKQWDVVAVLVSFGLSITPRDTNGEAIYMIGTNGSVEEEEEGEPWMDTDYVEIPDHLITWEPSPERARKQQEQADRNEARREAWKFTPLPPKHEHNDDLDEIWMLLDN